MASSHADASSHALVPASRQAWALMEPRAWKIAADANARGAVSGESYWQPDDARPAPCPGGDRANAKAFRATAATTIVRTLGMNRTTSRTQRFYIPSSALGP